MISSSTDLSEPNTGELIDINRVDNLTKLLRITALVLKFTKKLLKRTVTTNVHTKGEVMTALDIKEAEKLWIILVQAVSFSEEIKYLRSNNRLCLFTCASTRAVHLRVDARFKHAIVSFGFQKVFK